MKTINGICTTEVIDSGRKIVEKKNKHGFECLTSHEKNVLIAYLEAVGGEKHDERSR